MSRILNEKFSLSLVVTGISFIALAVFLFLYKVEIFNTELRIDGELFGQFGDIIGGVVGSLWALAGVILFYVGLSEQRKALGLNESALSKQIDALEVQRDEMKLLREEYRMAREVFEQQKEAIKEQVKTNSVQQFESNFYSLLDIYTHITDDIFKEDGELKKINQIIRDRYKCENDDSMRERFKKTVVLYNDVFSDNGDKISHYLKTVYRIFKVIDERVDFSDKQKYFYAKIMRSQFTNEELFIIYYNACSTYGANFRTLILKYNILKHLSFLSKLESGIYKSKYPEYYYQREIFCDGFSSGLGDFLDYVDDFSSEELRHNIEIKLDDVSVSIDFRLDDDDVLYVDLFITEKLHEKLGFKVNHTKNFLLDFITDTLFYSNFEVFDDSDIVNEIDSQESQFTLMVKTNKKMIVKKDLY